MKGKRFLQYIIFSIIQLYSSHFKVFAVSEHAAHPKTLIKTEKSTSNNDHHISKIYSDKAIKNFLDKLKDAVNKGDKAAVTKMISYPCRCVDYKNRKSKKSYVANEKEFIEKYDMIITPYIKEALNEIDEIWSNDFGITIGRGVIWFNPEDGIIAINHPRKERQ